MQDEKTTIVISIAITSVFILVLVLFIVFVLYIYQRRQIRHVSDITILKSDFEKTLLSTQLEIQEQTLQNISREIHDNIGLLLTLAKLNLNTIEWNKVGQSKEKVSGSVQYISKAIEDLSYISKTLHTDYIEENGLLNALELEVKKICSLGLFQIEFEVTGSPLYMKTQKELVIFRIIQEVLNNSIKHAQATSLRILLNYRRDYIDIELNDNGKGFDPDYSYIKSKKGTGLMNIVKRTSLIEGSCELKSEQGKGTTIRMQIPY